VYNLGKNTADGNGNIQFFLTFPNQGIFQCFTGFDLAAYELPKQASGFVGRTLADEKFTLLPNQCSNYFCHKETSM
jgi:hypothetical protein